MGRIDYFVTEFVSQTQNLSKKYNQIFSEGMKLIFIEDLPKNEISIRYLVKIFMRSHFLWEIYWFSFNDHTKIICRKNLMKKAREDEIYQGENLLDIKSFRLRIFSLQNFREIFQRKSINFSSKLKPHEDLHSRSSWDLIFRKIFNEDQLHILR